MAEISGLDSRHGQEIVLFFTTSRPALEPTHQIGTWSSFIGLKRPEYECDHSSSSGVEVKMRVVVSPFLHTSQWDGPWFKYRSNIASVCGVIYFVLINLIFGKDMRHIDCEAQSAFCSMGAGGAFLVYVVRRVFSCRRIPIRYPYSKPYIHAVKLARFWCFDTKTFYSRDSYVCGCWSRLEMSQTKAEISFIVCILLCIYSVD
jgi:hypothetical protein